MTNMEPELITILEGPTPEFQSQVQLWNWAIYQGPQEADVGYCELRTNNGEDIRERCKQAWKEGRSVQLDYPDALRMRQQANVVSMRLRQQHEGTVLGLWVYLPISDEEAEIFDGDIDDDVDDGLIF